MRNDVDLKAIFIGDKAENGDFYKEQMDRPMESHFGWREDYQPGDEPSITLDDQRTPEFLATKEHIEDVLDQVDSRLRAGSIPWASAGRYWGQMNSDTLLPAMLAYSQAMM